MLDATPRRQAEVTEVGEGTVVRGGFRIGRIAGIPISVNPSVLFVVALVTWSLAEEQLPDLAAGESTGSYWMVGALLAFLFFLSLLAHEGAHAVVAEHEGVKVSGLSLWLFGGVAFLEGESPTPRADLRIAIAGPLTSIFLSIAFGVVAVALDGFGAAEIIVAAATWLATVNMVLALFNLVPGAPLDGGRVLRARLWQRSGDRYRASITAARAGRWVGMVLVVLGIVEFVFGLGIGGLWLVFIGWFIRSAAGQEEADAIVRRELRDLRVADAMRSGAGGIGFGPGRGRGQRPAAVVTPDDSLVVARDRIAAAGTEEAVVVDNGRAVGIVTQADILRAAKLRARHTVLARRVPPSPPPPPWHGVISGRR